MPRAASAAPAGALDPIIAGLRFESHATFVLDLAAHAVHVRLEMTVTNQRPNTFGGGVVREYFYPKLVLPVGSEATNLVASKQDGTALTVDAASTNNPWLSTATVTLKPALFYNQTQTITFAYDLPGQPARSPGTTRSNDAVSAFAVFVLGDPGITSATVIVPAGLDVELAGVDMNREKQADGSVVMVADPIADPLRWAGVVVATDDDKLLRADPKVPDHEIELRGWPGDQPWVDFVSDTLQRGVPVLEQLIGLPWPKRSSTLAVTETVSPYLYGYAGWYRTDENKIDIGDELSSEVILHELSHVWFNHRMFRDRWIAEGLAQEYAVQAAAALGGAVAAPAPLDQASPVAFPLLDWGSPAFQDQDEHDREGWGYNASWAVVRSILNEVGLEKMKAVYDAAASFDISYVGDPEPETVRSIGGDWRVLLDLVQERTGSTTIEATLSSYVLGDAERALLPARDAARADYGALVEEGRGWTPPRPVREAMTFWSFATANDGMDAARAVLHQRDEIATTLEPIGMSVPAALETSYERESLDTTGAQAASDLEAARALVAASQIVDGDHGVLEAVGLFGSSADHTMTEAKRAFEGGDAAAAIASAKRAREIVADATLDGALRIASVVLLASLLFTIRRWGDLRASAASL